MRRAGPQSGPIPALNAAGRSSTTDKMRLLFLAPDFGWPAVRGGHVRVLSQLAVLSSLPEVERIRVFWLSEERASFTTRAGLAREMPKLDVLDPIFHSIYLFQNPRYI